MGGGDPGRGPPQCGLQHAHRRRRPGRRVGWGVHVDDRIGKRVCVASVIGDRRSVIGGERVAGGVAGSGRAGTNDQADATADSDPSARSNARALDRERARRDPDPGHAGRHDRHSPGASDGRPRSAALHDRPCGHAGFAEDRGVPEVAAARRRPDRRPDRRSSRLPSLLPVDRRHPQRRDVDRRRRRRARAMRRSSANACQSEARPSA